MASKTVSFLLMYVVVLNGITQVRSHPMMETTTEVNTHEKGLDGYTILAISDKTKSDVIILDCRDQQVNSRVWL